MRRVIGFCRRGVGMAALAPVLVACAAKPLAPTIAYHPSGTDKTIVLLTPYVPPQPTLASLTPVTLIGHLGGLLAYGYDQQVQKEHEAAFDAMLARQGFRPRAVLERDITNKLEAEGYSVQGLAVGRSAHHFLAAYPPAPPGAALELDVVLVELGYFRINDFTSYRPILELKYRLVRAGSGKLLAEGAADYSALGGGTPPDAAYSYSGYDRFAADPSRAAKALSDLLGRSAGKIAAGLR